MIGKHQIDCFLDYDNNHPNLYGECILPRDDDGMGFSLGLEGMRGMNVRITIEPIDDDSL